MVWYWSMRGALKDMILLSCGKDRASRQLGQNTAGQGVIIVGVGRAEDDPACRLLHIFHPATAAVEWSLEKIDHAGRYT
ncbi:hypothetical protein E2C01_101560 [Portunus trituberculatus]|uniref:Uncharacterized protein n=1 Tax=Portunus trituberculatus TaxID=210409 RepID=A0A5B7KG15_PORTR|nr:hypothetical protein [Portunus trituberculatus]